jgi:hypothetical protein
VVFSNAKPLTGDNIQLFRTIGSSDENTGVVVFINNPELAKGGVPVILQLIVSPLVPLVVVTVPFIKDELPVPLYNIPGPPVNVRLPATGLALVIDSTIVVELLPDLVRLKTVSPVASAPVVVYVVPNNSVS